VMPKMGDTMEEGKILRWIKHEGDTVQKGDALAEIETDKVNIEAEAFATGVLRKIIAQEGESIPIGQPIALIGKADEPLPDEATTAAKPAKAASKQAQANGTAATVTPASAAGTAVAEPVAPETAGADQNGQNGGRVFISPLARHIAAEHNLDISHIAGTGPGGRIVRDDVRAYLASPQEVTATPTTPQAQPASARAGVPPVESDAAPRDPAVSQ